MAKINHNELHVPFRGCSNEKEAQREVTTRKKPAMNREKGKNAE